MSEKKDYYDLDDLFDNVPQNIKEKNKGDVVEENFLEKRFVKMYNETESKSSIYQCDKCKNKGMIAYLNEYGKGTLTNCSCYRIRKNREKMQKLGLLSFLDENNSLEQFVVEENWQQYMKEKAQEYLANPQDNWLMVGGNVGSGKTKLCAIIFSKLLENDPEQTCEYLRWDSEYKDLTYPTKEEKNDIKARIEDYKNCDILYIDDFIRIKNKSDFKTDVSNLAKSIIDYRYMKGLKTIISTELFYNEMEEIDEAIASRIYQRCKNGTYIISINRKKERNVRKNIEII